MVLTLDRSESIVFTYDDATHLLAVRPASTTAPAGVVRSDRALARNSLRAPLTRERFYFVMADRFADADPANNQGGLSGDRDVTGYDPTGKGWYHGGDIAGLTKKISYIKRPRHDRDLAHTIIQEQAGPGHGFPRRVRATTATGSPTSPRSTRTSAPTPRTAGLHQEGARQEVYEGLLRHRHQPHR